MNFYTEKSEKPTPKHLKKAKEKGQFPYSPFFGSSLLFLSVLLLFFFHFSTFCSVIKTFFISSLFLMTTFHNNSLFTVFMPLIKEVAILLIIITSLSFLAHSWQNHFSFSWKREKRKKSHKAYFAFYTLVSWSLMSLLGYFSLLSLYNSFSQDIIDMFRQLFFIIVKINVLFFVLSLVDYLFQRHFFYQDMHMTKEEIKEEWKEEKVAKK